MQKVKNHIKFKQITTVAKMLVSRLYTKRGVGHQFSSDISLLKMSGRVLAKPRGHERTLMEEKGVKKGEGLSMLCKQGVKKRKENSEA